MVSAGAAALEVDPDQALHFNSARLRKQNQLSAKLTESLDAMREEIQAVDRAKLYWVARSMVPVAVNAAETLPEWTPELAVPSEAGLLCWATPAGSIPFGNRGEVPWDAAWWWRRPDGIMQIQVASRLAQRQELLAPFGVSAPIWSGTTLLVNPSVPRTEEVEGSPQTSKFVSILGATWLLMEQRTVAETRSISRPTKKGRGERVSGPSSVSIVELRRQLAQPTEHPKGESGRKYSSRWTVDAHWRQQACGPGWSQRKPVYITEYEKGPPDAPPKTDKVYSWRR